MKPILLSVHPAHTLAILGGSKTVEVRRQPIGSNGQRILLYATAPTSAVVGEFTMRELVEDTPQGLWHRYGRGTGITSTAFFGYVGDLKRCYGLVVGTRLQYDEPIRLPAGLRAPRSYQQLDTERPPHRALLQAVWREVGPDRKGQR